MGPKKINHKPPGSRIFYPASFFNGASQGNRCECGFSIAFSPEQAYWVHWGAGSGTNTGEEAMALWGLLWFTKYLNIPKIHIFGDSKIIIDYVMGYAKIYQPSLHGWLYQIEQLWASFKDSTIEHIGRDFNQIAD